MNFKAEQKRIARLIQSGLEKLESGEAGDALLDFESALFFDSDNLAANYLAAACLSRLGRPIEAEELALKAIELAPDLAIPHLIAAEVLAAAGREDEAEFHLIEGVSKEPHNPRLLVELARFLILTNRPDEACGHLRRSLEISPKLADGRLLLALGLSQQGRWIEAENELDGLLELEKIDAGSLALAGWLRMIRAHDLNSSEPKLDEYKRAVELLTRANQLNPSIEFARELLDFGSAAVERVGKPADAEVPQPNRLRQAAIAVGVIVFVVSFSGGFLWLANRSFSAAMLAALGMVAFEVIVMFVVGLKRRDFSFLPSGMFMIIDRATKGGLTRWSNPVVTDLLGVDPNAVSRPAASPSDDELPTHSNRASH